MGGACRRKRSIAHAALSDTHLWRSTSSNPQVSDRNSASEFKCLTVWLCRASDPHASHRHIAITRSHAPPQLQLVTRPHTDSNHRAPAGSDLANLSRRGQVRSFFRGRGRSQGPPQEPTQVTAVTSQLRDLRSPAHPSPRRPLSPSQAFAGLRLAPQGLRPPDPQACVIPRPCPPWQIMNVIPTPELQNGCDGQAASDGASSDRYDVLPPSS